MFLPEPPENVHSAAGDGAAVKPSASVVVHVATPRAEVMQVPCVPSIFCLVHVVAPLIAVVHVVESPVSGSVDEVDDIGSDPAANVVLQFTAPFALDEQFVAVPSELLLAVTQLPFASQVVQVLLSSLCVWHDEELPSAWRVETMRLPSSLLVTVQLELPVDRFVSQAVVVFSGAASVCTDVTMEGSPWFTLTVVDEPSI
jgi:hypothetical protein